jgi:hypothetical protein
MAIRKSRRGAHLASSFGDLRGTVKLERRPGARTAKAHASTAAVKATGAADNQQIASRNVGRQEDRYDHVPTWKKRGELLCAKRKDSLRHSREAERCF